MINIDKARLKADRPLFIYFAVLVAIMIFASVFKANDYYVQAFFYDKAMPVSFTATAEDGKEFYFRREKNPDFKLKTDKDNPLKRYRYYIKDSEGNEKEYAFDEKFDYKDLTGTPPLFFTIRSIDNLAKLRQHLIIAEVVAIIIIVIIGIVCWFLSWSAREDLKKDKAFRNQNNNRKKS